jgi:hypothetical protein
MALAHHALERIADHEADYALCGDFAAALGAAFCG